MIVEMQHNHQMMTVTLTTYNAEIADSDYAISKGDDDLYVKNLFDEE